MNRRQAHLKKRRVRHAKMRAATVIWQGKESSSEGPDDSPIAQKAQRSLKSRKALHLRFFKTFDKVKKRTGLQKSGGNSICLS